MMLSFRGAEWIPEPSMSRSKSKSKPRKFSAAGEARRRARELAGPPPAARVIPDKRLKPPKHKKKLLEEADK
jgi:hypothetical protein